MLASYVGVELTSSYLNSESEKLLISSWTPITARLAPPLHSGIPGRPVGATE